MKAKWMLMLLSVFVISGCAGTGGAGRADMACKQGIDYAYDALSLARSEGFSGTVAWSKASALLTAAKVQEQLENYSDCLDKVEKARFYINQSQGG